MNMSTIRKQSGFTLIELMIVVAIIAILLAIALPAYQDYTVRAKMSEALNAAGPARMSVAEYAISEGDWPSTAGFTTNIDTEYVASVRWTNDNIVVSITNDVGGDTSSGDAILLSPFTSTGGAAVEWTCTGASGFPDKYLPANCRS